MPSKMLEYILDLWEKYYFSIPLVILGQIGALLFCFRYWKMERVHILLTIYTTVGLALFLSYHVLMFDAKNNNRFSSTVLEIFNQAFAITEILFFCSFFKRVLKSHSTKLIVHFGVFIFFIAVIYFVLSISKPNFSLSQIRTLADRITTSELLFLGFLSLIYLYELFKYPTARNLAKSPSFWIVSFSLPYTIILPLLLFLLEILRTENVDMFKVFVSLHYVSLSLVFFGITKALLCKKSLTS